MIQAPRGTKDILPGKSNLWHYVEAIMREACRRAGYREMRTPNFEHTELFQRGIGDTTDVVQKEMYTFMDKGGRSITLKPEGTAGAARAFVEHGLYNDALPLKLYYLATPIFRYEAPQSGRLREHHQFGVEVFGAPNASVDAETIALAYGVAQKVGLQNLTVHINSIGCPACRPTYQQALKAWLQPKLPELCATCRERFERNPLRVLDCKVPSCKALTQGAPVSLEHLCPECETHFAALQAALRKLDIPFIVDPGIVRGLDYYTKTVFELITTLNGEDMTLCGGGRYDGLVKEIGGPAVPATGFGMGIERLLLFLEEQGLAPEEAPLFDVYIASMGEAAGLEAIRLTQALRDRGVAAECDHCGRSLKAQFKYAGKLGVGHVVVIGEDELAQGQYKLRNMATKAEETLPPEAILHTLGA